jgi:hypothetical protein
VLLALLSKLDEVHHSLYSPLHKVSTVLEAVCGGDERGYCFDDYLSPYFFLCKLKKHQVLLSVSDCLQSDASDGDLVFAADDAGKARVDQCSIAIATSVPRGVPRVLAFALKDADAPVELQTGRETTARDGKVDKLAKKPGC